MVFLIVLSFSLQVKALLYEIRRLMIIDHGTAVDDKVSTIMNYLYSKAVNSNKFYSVSHKIETRSHYIDFQYIWVVVHLNWKSWTVKQKINLRVGPVCILKVALACIFGPVGWVIASGGGAIIFVSLTPNSCSFFEIRVLTILIFQVSTCLFHPAYEDLKFRVCNLFDLTNKQFVTVRPAVKLETWSKSYGKRRVISLTEVTQRKLAHCVS